MLRPGQRLLRGLIVAEAIAFGLSVAVIWLDEWLDLPRLFFGDPASPARFREAGVESAGIVVGGILAVSATVALFRRLRRLESYIAICAWCREVHVDGRWMKFEEFLLLQADLRATHGICEECAEKLKRSGAPD
jgi:voltage-gated potassium channel Kch